MSREIDGTKVKGTNRAEFADFRRVLPFPGADLRKNHRKLLIWGEMAGAAAFVTGNGAKNSWAVHVAPCLPSLFLWLLVCSLVCFSWPPFLHCFLSLLPETSLSSPYFSSDS